MSTNVLERLHRTGRIFRGATVIACLCVVLATTSVGVASAAPTYSVMNTSEYPPDGVYFRTAADWNLTARVNGLGFYAGDRVELQCWQPGTNVPRRDGGSNTVWYQAKNVTRPTAPNGQSNQGWINAHFVNDGLGPNEHVSTVGRCDIASPPPAPAPSPTSQPASTVYYSPYSSPSANPATWLNGRYDALGSPAVLTDRREIWTTSTRCSTANAQRGITGATHALAGWSVGRLGPLYYLANATAAQKNQIDYILMIDPGDYIHDLGAGSCDNAVLAPAGQRSGDLLASWLSTNPRARLVVLSGNRTTDSAHPVNGYANAGIQNVYFNAIRSAQQRSGGDLRSRVMVCNYPVDHQSMFTGVKDRIGQRFTTCPAVGGTAATARWSP